MNPCSTGSPTFVKTTGIVLHVLRTPNNEDIDGEVY